MTTEQINKLIKDYNWQPWLKRPWYGFLISTFTGGNTPVAFKKIGLQDWQCDFLFSDGEWYKSDKAYSKAKPKVLAWLKHHSVSEITDKLEQSHLKWLPEVKQLAKNPNQQLPQKLKTLSNILKEVSTYIWATHILEYYFTPLLRQQVSKFVKSDVDKFIGDAAFPSKPNSAERMVEEYKRGVSVKVLAERYGWMRSRDCFSAPYTAKEIKNIVQHALKQRGHKHPKIPKSLEKIFVEARTLVYFRTLRTDIYYELAFWAKPLLKAAAKKLGIPFAELKFYSMPSLIAGKPKRLNANFSGLSINGKYFEFNKPIITNSTTSQNKEIRGAVAQAGIVRGTAKVLMEVNDQKKVKKGDILITYMTSPNFLPAMKLAAGFVTDEGGLTCHAAIVAREMKKPCIIGTKIATKIFKDGDLVEVDANKGIVKKIK